MGGTVLVSCELRLHAAAIVFRRCVLITSLRLFSAPPFPSAIFSKVRSTSPSAPTASGHFRTHTLSAPRLILQSTKVSKSSKGSKVSKSTKGSKSSKSSKGAKLFKSGKGSWHGSWRGYRSSNGEYEANEKVTFQDAAKESANLLVSGSSAANVGCVGTFLAVSISLLHVW